MNETKISKCYANSILLLNILQICDIFPDFIGTEMKANWIECNADLICHSRSQVRVYSYPVNYCFHLADIMAFFGQLDVWIRWPTFNDYSISETIQQIVMAFVNRNNSSELSQSFHWQPFPKQVAEIVSQLNYTSIVTTNYRQSDRCYFWRSENFFNYMWTVWSDAEKTHRSLLGLSTIRRQHMNNVFVAYLSEPY